MLKTASFAIALMLAMGTLGLADATPPPILVSITNCNFELIDHHNGNFGILASLTFMNITKKPMRDIRFIIGQMDAFGKVRTIDAGEVHGDFAPDVHIEPRRAYNGAIFPAGSTFPSSPAWEFYSPLGKDLDHIACLTGSVRYEDGTVVQFYSEQ